MANEFDRPDLCEMIMAYFPGTMFQWIALTSNCRLYLDKDAELITTGPTLICSCKGALSKAEISKLTCLRCTPILFGCQYASHLYKLYSEPGRVSYMG